MARAIPIQCQYCAKTCLKESGAVNRANKIGAPLFCNMTCAGLNRRQYKTEQQKKEDKCQYDKEYRTKNRHLLAEKKRRHFEKTYDPVAAAIERKKNMHRHVEYCRRPEYREKKKGYDRRYRAEKLYGEYADAALILLDIETVIDQRITRYEIYQQNGYFQKVQQRRRYRA